MWSDESVVQAPTRRVANLVSDSCWLVGKRINFGLNLEKPIKINSWCRYRWLVGWSVKRGNHCQIYFKRYSGQDFGKKDRVGGSARQTCAWNHDSGRSSQRSGEYRMKRSLKDWLKWEKRSLNSNSWDDVDCHDFRHKLAGGSSSKQKR